MQGVLPKQKIHEDKHNPDFIPIDSLPDYVESDDEGEEQKVTPNNAD